MKTDTTFVKGRVVLSLDLNELIDSIPIEDQSDLMQRIACEEAVIKAVVDQLLTGWTENASCGYDDTTFDPTQEHSPNALTAARERLVKGADAAARLMIDRLRRALRHAREQSMADWRKAFDIQRDLRDQLQLARREHAEAIQSRDYWHGFASRINAERPAASTGVTP